MFQNNIKISNRKRYPVNIFLYYYSAKILTCYNYYKKNAVNCVPFVFISYSSILQLYLAYVDVKCVTLIETSERSLSLVY